MNKTHFIILTVYLIFFTAQISQAEENKAYLKDGKIIVETPEGVKALDYDNPNGGFTTQMISDRWTVKQEINPVEEGLAVFKNKSTPVYLQRIILFDKGGSGEDFVFEFYTDNNENKPVYSPNKDYLYFLGTSGDGVTSVYGHNLNTRKQFLIPNSHSFQMLNCGNNSSFIAVEKDDQNGSYFIYDLGGHQLNSYSNLNAYDKLQQTVCNE